MKKNIIILISFFLFILFFVIGFFLWQGVYSPKNQEAVEAQLFFIEQGEGVEEIAFNLENQNLIKCQYLFKFYVLAKGVFPELQAGVYQLSPSMSISEIVNKIVTGDVFTKKITIPEGFNIREIEERFSEVFKREMNFSQFLVVDFQGEEDKSSSSPLADARVDKFNFLKDMPKDRTLEGFLLPDTYEFYYLVDEKKVIREMLKNFDKRLTSQIRKEITRQEKEIFDIIIMASLLEEEVRGLEDKKIVSDIFWRRIKTGIPLQSCATVAYVLQKEKTTIEWSFKEMRKEIGQAKQIDSPYNTYIHKGLPIGPISNPGMNSILATIYSEPNDYWFFLSTSDGKTIFSRTLQEHNVAKAKHF